MELGTNEAIKQAILAYPTGNQLTTATRAFLDFAPACAKGLAPASFTRQ